LLLRKQGEQGVDDHGALELAGPAESLGAEEVEGPPDQLEVEAEGEHAPGQGRGELAGFVHRYRTAWTRSMQERSRRSGRSATRASSGSQRFRTRGRARGARRSTQLMGPR